MKKIQLSQGKVALVDDEDYPELSKHTWYMKENKTGIMYAYRTTPGRKNKTSIYMHREIMKFPKGMVIDHKNGDGLNNQKENLRICTASANLINRKKSKNKSSETIGVSFDKTANKWYAYITLNKKMYNLGLHSDINDAILARRKAEIENGFERFR